MSDDLIPANLPGWLAPHAEAIQGWPAVNEWPTSTGYLPTPRGPEPVCQVAACDRTAMSLDLCGAHYDRFRRAAAAEGLTTREYVDAYAAEVFQAPPVRTPEPVCWVEACDRTARTSGLCKAHHMQTRRLFPREERGVARASDSETGREEAR